MFLKVLKVCLTQKESERKVALARTLFTVSSEGD
jgi:hypothetical protein